FLFFKSHVNCPPLHSFPTRRSSDLIGFGWYNVEFIAKYLAPRLGKKPAELRIAYIAEDSSYGQGVTEAARERAKKEFGMQEVALDRKSTRLNSSHRTISYAVFCLKK